MKILNAHFLYPVDEVWGMCKVDVLCCFVVIYIVKICVFPFVGKCLVPVYSDFSPHTACTWSVRKVSSQLLLRKK
jgi:hypothetical protein